MLSVILCTHNPRPAYLLRTLEGLRGQTLACTEWNILLIDNRSDLPLAGRIDLSWHERARIIREDNLGLTPARLRGIRESRADLVVFVDDDNVLDADYLEQARRVSQDRPFLGSWSGQCRAGFEQPPPEWTRRYWGSLAIREFDTDRWSNLPRLAETMPCGAGLCVRRAVAEHYLHLHDSGQRTFQFDRTGSGLISGGDHDLAACACDLGLGLGLVAALRLTHLIPPERLSLDYLRRLTECIHFSSIMLDHERGGPAHLPSIGRRLVNEYHRLSMEPHHAAISRAAERGEKRARRLIASSPRPPDQPHRSA